MYRQYDLRSGDERRTCWLFVPGPRALTIGTRLTLTGDARMWTVTAYSAVMLDTPPDQRWGLDLPKGQRTER